MTRHRPLSPPRPRRRLAGPAAALALVAGAALVAGCSAEASTTEASTTGDTTANAAPGNDAEVVAQVEAAFDEWNAALATDDAATVAARYTEDGLLLSTLSADIREGRDEIEGYFAADFLPKKPQGVITESHVDVIDRDSAVHSGLYDFTVTDEEGETKVVPARFTYVYELVDGDWLIASHHSSVQPEG